MRFVVISLFVIGCQSSSSGDSAPIDSEPADSDVNTDTGVPWDDDTATPENVQTVIGLTGTLRWDVDFDEAAEAAGFVDCHYVRTYTEGAELQNSPWTCPGCDVVVTVNDAMTEGRDDCYGQFNSSDPNPTEVLGWGGGRFYRTYFENYALSDQGTSAVDGDSLATSNVTAFQFEANSATYNAQFTTTGDFAIGEAERDPMRGLHEPESYECGWIESDPPEYTGDYQLVVGETVPDGLFRDVCNDPVRLQDLGGSGRWMIIDVAAMDCGPCQAMADTERAFVDRMHEEGIEVQSVTLLAPALADTLGTPTRDQLYDWAFAFDPETPILADRGFGVWVIGASTATQAGEDFGYPTWVVVDPELKVKAVHVGFSSWDDVEAEIRR